MFNWYKLIVWIGLLIAVYMLLTVVVSLIMQIAAGVNLWKSKHRDRIFKPYPFEHRLHHELGISIIVPAFNEEAGIIDSVRSLLNLNYSQYEIIVVNDGSTDQTANKMIDTFAMKPIRLQVDHQLAAESIISVYRSEVQSNIWLVNKVNGGKADSLNAGINFAHFPYFCSIDGDSLLDQDAMTYVMKPFADFPEKTAVSGGSIQPISEVAVDYGVVSAGGLADKPLAAMQEIEYLRAFNVGRVALSAFNMALVISGAFSVFDKKMVIAVGGYSTDMIGEDMELIVKCHRYLKDTQSQKRIVHVPEAKCYTEAPVSLSILGRQRRRWYQGLIASLWKHRDMLLQPKYGLIGMVSFPYFFWIEALGPFMELAGYLYLILSFFMGAVFIEFSLLLLVIISLYSVLSSLIAMLFEAWISGRDYSMRDIIYVIGLSLAEIVWYKPLSLLWRLQGWHKFLKKNNDWGEMERQGFEKEGADA